MAMNGQNESMVEGQVVEKITGSRLAWERPAIERLGADQAETSNFNYAANDGLIYTS